MCETFSRLQAAHLRLGELDLSGGELRTLLELDKLAQEQARQPAEMSTPARGDRESELEAWLESQGIESPWEIAPALANLGYDCDGLNGLIAGFAPYRRALTPWAHAF